MDSELLVDSEPRITRRLLNWSSVRWYVYTGVLSLIISGQVFWRLSRYGSQSDIFSHASIANQLISENHWFVYSIYYPIQYLSTIGYADPEIWRISSTVLLTLFTIIKSFVTLYFARKFITHPGVAFVVTLGVMVATPIFNLTNPVDIYLGQLSPNVWHNSTTVLASIFILPTFLYGVTLLKRPTLKTAVAFSALITITTLAKPNFTTVLIPVVAIWGLLNVIRVKQQRIRHLLQLMVAVLPAVIVLSVQYYLTFTLGTSAFDKSTNKIALFEVWSTYSHNIPLSILLSICGPLLTLFVIGRAARRSTTVILSWVIVGVACLEYALFSEVTSSGISSFNGNWSWATIPAMSLLFFVSMVELVRAAYQKNFSLEIRWLQALTALVFVLHLATGLYWVLSLGYSGFPTFVL